VGPKKNRVQRPRSPVGSCENSYFRKRTVAVLLQILQMTNKILKLEVLRPVKLAEHDETRDL
jgi:hypothetical protein